MIPLSLELKNFLSYGPELQKIDFEPYHLICLSGKNGHGKSSLLDAITWALWGQARKVGGISKADAGLLRLGQTQMIAILTFSCNGNTYRVRREYFKSYGKPITTLDLGIQSPDGSGFESITDKSITVTQRKLEAIIGLSYDTFINSAFLRQGGSNEFSKKSPKERKEILASILGLDRFERLRKYILEKTRITQQEVQQKTTLINHLQEQLNAYEPLRAQQSQTSEELLTTQAAEQQLHSSQEQIQQQQINLQTRFQERTALLTRLHTIEEHERQLQQQLQARYKEWKQVHAQLLEKVELTALVQQREDIAQRIQQHQHALQHQLTLKQEILQTQEQCQQQANALLAQHSAQQQQLEIAHTQVKAQLDHWSTLMHHYQQQSTQLQHELQQTTQELQALQKSSKTTPAADIAYLEQQFEKRRMYYQKYIAEGNCIVTQLTELKQKRIFTHDPTNPSCPLCEQNLTTARKRFLQAKFTAQESFARHRLQRLTNLISSLKTVLIKQHEQIQQLKQHMQEDAIRNHRIQELTRTAELYHHKINELNKTVTQLTNQIATSEQQEQTLSREINTHEARKKQLLTDNLHYTALFSTIETLQQRLSTYHYNEQEHATLVQQLHELEQRITRHSNVSHERALQAKRKEDIHHLCTTLKQIKRDKKHITETISTYSTLEGHYAQLQEEQQRINQQLHAQRTEKERLLQERGRIEHHLQLLQGIEQECQSQQKSIREQVQHIEHLQTLTVALGKDGLQALLIEEALPDIEHETNALLAQLTDNQAQVRFESLRDLKSGKTKETLDINISDAQGIRPYEMFSGGEAFRIDFALRIAISKLLAQRAGATLQTLIIDEGFGSQDEEGLQYITEALHAIQRDFAKIIIVSHLPSMKDAFPVHFLINKGPNGSNIRVIEQG